MLDNFKAHDLHNEGTSSHLVGHLETPYGQEAGAQNLDSSQSNDVSLIDRLPSEVMGHIFQSFVDDEVETWSEYNGIPRLMGPLPLGAVCQTWRQVAWTTPRLWAVFSFCLTEKTTEGQIQLAVQWIERSAEVPMSIKLSRFVESEESLLGSVMDAVNQALHRCHVLVLLNMTFLSMSRLSRASHFLCAVTTLHLTVFELETAVPPDSSTVTPLLDFRSAAPTALEVGLMDMKHLVLNWRNLNQFVGYELSSNDVLHVLRDAPQVKKCHLSGFKVSNFGERVDNVICQSLEEFKFDAEDYSDDIPQLLTGVFGSELTNLFNLLTLPNLTKCSIKDVKEFPTNSFLIFIHRSHCQVTDLFLDEQSISGGDLVLITTALPSITSFTLQHNLYFQDIQDLSPFFEELCLDEIDADVISGGKVLLPNLKHLSVETSDDFHWELVPGFRGEISHTPNSNSKPQLSRPHLESISITYHFSDPEARSNSIYRYKYPSDYVPEHLIQDWDDFSDILELENEVQLTLTIDTNYSQKTSLLSSSYQSLLKVYGQPPSHIKNYMDRFKERSRAGAKGRFTQLPMDVDGYCPPLRCSIDGAGIT